MYDSVKFPGVTLEKDQTRHAFGSCGKAKVHRPDKRFLRSGHYVYHTKRPRNALPQNAGCLVLGISRTDLRPTTNRPVVLLFQARRENGRVFLVTGHFHTV